MTKHLTIEQQKAVVKLIREGYSPEHIQYTFGYDIDQIRAAMRADMEQLLVDRKPMHKKHQDIYDSLPEVFTTSKAIEICTNMGYPKHTFQAALNTKAFGSCFTRLSHGLYQKLAIFPESDSAE